MEPPSPYRITLRNDSGRRPRTAPLVSAVRDTLARWNIPPGEICLRLSDDESLRELNRAYRGIDETTDVLTFPAAAIPCPKGRRRPLGDVAISVPQAERQAQERGYGIEWELAYLGIHAVLHLAGLDDETKADRVRMMAAMSESGERCGLPPLGDWYTLAPAGASR